jgi:hypothetical protein
MQRPIYLTEEELHGITKRKKYAAQIRALNVMGIEHTKRPDGSPLVSRLAYERKMGGIDTKITREELPDFRSLDAT